ncbi:MAG: aldehyde ferredoxin oxidoreductase family protein [bacterium]
MAGYWNKIIEVDLTAKTIKESKVADDDFQKYVGGSGIGAKMLFERLNPGLDPLAPENPLIIMTGPLTGSRFPGSVTRFGVTGRSPLTGLFGEASCGGNFGVSLKRCGFDGIIVTGASETPVMLEIGENSFELKDASDLWGKDTYEVDELLNQRAIEAGNKGPAVFCIGPAGENLVKFANIMNGDGNAAGRCGLGALMGSKKLKAITARGALKPIFADSEKMEQLRKVLLEKTKESVAVQSMTAFGTAGSVDLGSMTGDLPLKNWSIGTWDEGVEKLSGPYLADTILTKNKACFGCPVACKRVVKVDDGPNAVPESAGPEYETVGTFGTQMMIPDLAFVSKCNEICNRLGMDTITCGATLAMMMDAMEAGVITPEDTGGLVFKFGEQETVKKALFMIAKREGFGDTLAEGSRGIYRKLGKGEEFTSDVKGLEAPMHDPRPYWGMGLNYAVGVRGACHVNTIQMFVEQGFTFYPQIGIGEEVIQYETDKKAFTNVQTQKIGGLLNAFCTCHFPAIPYDEDDFLGMLNTTTGFNYSLDDMMAAGDRIWLLKRGINIMLGATNADDKLPQKFMTPVEDGAAAGMVPDLEPMLAEFYKIRDIDAEGRPSRAILEQIGLKELADMLHE